MSDIFTGTPADLTYLHPLVREAWLVVWAIVTGALVVILGWLGLSCIVQHLLGSRDEGWRELVPRLVLGLVAAATSRWHPSAWGCGFCPTRRAGAGSGCAPS